jgi:flagellar biosynthesis/type III secretory pathway M-ring protein FliF/YscJ
MSARQQVLTTRLQESLAIYPGVAVAVQFEMPVEITEKTETADSPDPHSDLSSLKQNNTAAEEPVAGANGQASIDDIPFAQLINQPVATAVAAPVAESLIATLHPRVSVTFDVPYEIAERYAADDAQRKSKHPQNEISDFGLGRSVAVHGDGYRRDEFGELAAIKSEIESIVRPVLDQELEASFPEAETQFSFRLLPPQAAVVSKSWQAKVQKVAEDNWPSLAVLVLGLVLIMLVAQTDPKARESASVDANVYSEILPFQSDGGTEGMASRITTGRGFANQRHGSESPETSSLSNNQHSNHSLADKEDAETRLAQLIESDPEAAAKVIESWIRDAA